MRRLLIAGAVALLGFAAVAANYHIVYGSKVKGLTFESKPSLTFSETLVNLDIVGNMPMIAARAQYPMYVAHVEKRVHFLTKGCGSVRVGMWRSEALERCGQPASSEQPNRLTEVFRWSDGVEIKIENGRVALIKS